MTSIPWVPRNDVSARVTSYGASAGSPMPGREPTTSMPQYSGRRMKTSGTSCTCMFAIGFVPDTRRTNCGGKLSSVTTSAYSKSSRRKAVAGGAEVKRSICSASAHGMLAIRRRRSGARGGSAAARRRRSRRERVVLPRAVEPDGDLAGALLGPAAGCLRRSRPPGPRSCWTNVPSGRIYMPSRPKLGGKEKPRSGRTGRRPGPPRASGSSAGTAPAGGPRYDVPARSRCRSPSGSPPPGGRRPPRPGGCRAGRHRPVIAASPGAGGQYAHSAPTVRKSGEKTSVPVVAGTSRTTMPVSS